MSASLAGAFDPSYPSDAPMFVVLVLGAKDWGNLASHIKRLSLVRSFVEIVSPQSTSSVSYEVSIISGVPPSVVHMDNTYTYGYARHIRVTVSYDGPLL
jgi:hypothetical protein